MATTNNTQGDEPRTTILEKQVQTLAAAVERLTKKNHDLEEQLRQKNAALNTQEEDQEGTNAERRNQEGPEGSNASSRQERLDASYPSATNTVPPHIVAEMQMMKERMDVMMNALEDGCQETLTSWSIGRTRPLWHQLPHSSFHQSFACHK